MNELEYHPFSVFFSLYSEDKLKLLSESIRKHGLDNPIILFEGKILDGRNRYLACLLAKVEPVFEEYDGNDPIRFVIRQNIIRRHLSTSQRIAAATLIANLEKGQRADVMEKSQIGTPSYVKPVTQSEISREFEVSPRSIRDGKRILREAPDKFQDIEIGKKTVHEVMREIQKGKRKPLAGVKLKNNDDDNFDSSDESCDFVNTVNPKTPLDFATCAVNCLKKIPYDDPSRKSCLELVAVWINGNM